MLACDAGGNSLVFFLPQKVICSVNSRAARFTGNTPRSSTEFSHLNGVTAAGDSVVSQLGQQRLRML